jgi:hypothetical protein
MFPAEVGCLRNWHEADEQQKGDPGYFCHFD